MCILGNLPSDSNAHSKGAWMDLITEQSPAESSNQTTVNSVFEALWKKMWTHRKHPYSHGASIPWGRQKTNTHMMSEGYDVMRKYKPPKPFLEMLVSRQESEFYSEMSGG